MGIAKDKAWECRTFKIEGQEKNLGEASDGVVLIGADVEDGVEAGELEKILDALREIQELDFALGAADGGEAAYELADAGAVYVIHVVEVEDNLALAAADQVVEGAAEHRTAFAERDLAA